MVLRRFEPMAAGGDALLPCLYHLSCLLSGGKARSRCRGCVWGFLVPEELGGWPPWVLVWTATVPSSGTMCQCQFRILFLKPWDMAIEFGIPCIGGASGSRA